MKSSESTALRNVDCRCVLAGLVILTLLCLDQAHAAWVQDEKSLAWLDGGKVIWQFNFDPAEGKPFFDPLTANGSRSLTVFGPEDHPWHYGLWFSWKYLNTVNYWEQDRTTGKAEGHTRWAAPRVHTETNGVATLDLAVDYVDPTGVKGLTERRHIRVSNPAADGTYTIDWRATFTAGTREVVLDRTPMPHEPNGQVNGGYAGMSVRLANRPVEVSLVTTEGPITEFVSHRARPDAPALAANCRMDGQHFGGLAMLSAASNIDEGSPWYAVMTEQMRFFCSAVLAPKPLSLTPGGKLDLTYRIIVRPEPWTAESLRAAVAEWGQ